MTQVRNRLPWDEGFLVVLRRVAEVKPPAWDEDQYARRDLVELRGEWAWSTDRVRAIRVRMDHDAHSGFETGLYTRDGEPVEDRSGWPDPDRIWNDAPMDFWEFTVNASRLAAIAAGPQAELVTRGHELSMVGQNGATWFHPVLTVSAHRELPRPVYVNPKLFDIVPPNAGPVTMRIGPNHQTPMRLSWEESHLKVEALLMERIR